jgi:hypothetical protein
MPTNVMNTSVAVQASSNSTANNNTGSSTNSTDVAGTEIRGRERQGSFGGSTKAKILKPFNTANIKILLLENVNETAVSALRGQGYQASIRNEYTDNGDVGDVVRHRVTQRGFVEYLCQPFFVFCSAASLG